MRILRPNLPTEFTAAARDVAGRGFEANADWHRTAACFLQDGWLENGVNKQYLAVTS